MLDQLNQAHQMAQVQYDKIKSRIGMLDAARKEIESLQDMGDLVDQDDVIKSASNLVAVGFTPEALAGLLADMPTNAQGMANWVDGLEKMMSQREAMLMPLMDQARFRLGTSAIQLLAGHHIANAMQASPGNAAAPQGQPGNAMEPMAPEDQSNG